LVSAAFETLGGPFDCYYQINVKTATDPVLFNNDFGFAGYATDAGYRTDGASLPGGKFVNGTDIPDSVFRGNDRVAFSFNVNSISSGQSSKVLNRVGILPRSDRSPYPNPLPFC
jgi:hypothetical protein